MTENEVRQKIVNIIASWVGCKQGDETHKFIVDTYNNHKPLAQNYKVKYTDAWCATTVSAAAIIAGYTKIIPTECSCSRMIELFKKKGIWVEDESYTPKPGDIVFYDWQDSGSGDNKGNADHVGICEKVIGNHIYVVEGNKNKECGRRVVNINGKYLRGFGVPDYKVLSKEEKLTLNDLPKKVRINVVNSLNIREGASTNTKTLGFLKAGSFVTISKIEGDFAFFEGYISAKDQYTELL